MGSLEALQFLAVGIIALQKTNIALAKTTCVSFQTFLDGAALVTY